MINHDKSLYVMIFEAWARRTNRCGALILEILWLFHIYVTLQEGIVLWRQWRWLSSPEFFLRCSSQILEWPNFFLGSTGGYLEGLPGGTFHCWVSKLGRLGRGPRGVGSIEIRVGGLLAPSFTDAHANAAGDALIVFGSKRKDAVLSKSHWK